jgi:hypothetical protein
MSVEIQGVQATGPGAMVLWPFNLDIPHPANASIGGVSFRSSGAVARPALDSVRELLLSEADWDFLITALAAPPTVSSALRRLLIEPSVLDR